MMPPEALEAMLDLLAVADQKGLTRTQLGTLLSRLGHVHGRRSFTSDHIDAAVASLPPTTWLSDRPAMSHHVGEPRRRALLRSGRHKALSTLILDIDPLIRIGSYYQKQLRETVAPRALRHALHHTPHDLEAMAPLQGFANIGVWFANPIPIDLMEALDSGMVAWILHNLTIASFKQATPIDDLYNAMAHFTRPNAPSVQHAAAATLALLQGDLDATALHLKRVPATDFPYPHALNALFTHNLSSSVSHFAKGLALERKRNGRRDIHPYRVEHAFLPLAYLLQGSTTRGKQARTFIERPVQDACWRTDVPWNGWAHLGALNPANPLPPEVDLTHPVAALLALLVAHWTDRPIDATTQNSAIERAEGLGWHGVAQALTLEGPLPELRESNPRWRQQLESILKLARPADSSSVAAQEAPERLLWTVSVATDGVYAKPLLQKRNKTGWTKGRAVAMSKLRPNAALPFSPADLAIVAALRTYRSGWHNDLTYDYDRKQLWRALVGHPGLIDTDLRPIAVVQGTVRLVRTTTPAGETFTLTPTLEASGIHVATIDNGFVVTTLVDGQRNFATALARPLTIPAGRPDELASLLEALQSVFGDIPEDGLEGEPGDPTVVAQLQSMSGAHAVTFVVEPFGPQGPTFPPGQGGTEVGWAHEGVTQRIVRDHESETELLRQATQLPGIEDVDGNCATCATLRDVLSFLEAASAASVPVSWPKGQPLTFRKTVSRSDLRLTVRNVKGWFEASGELHVDENQVLSLIDLLRRMDPTGRFVHLDDNSWIALEESLRRQLDALSRTSKANKKGVLTHPLTTSALEALAESGSSPVPRALRTHTQKMATLPSVVDIPKGLQTPLRDYQYDAVQWIARLAHIQAGGILADDMGLGKTITTLAMLLHRKKEGPALVIAPTSVGGNWVNEATRFAPSLRVQRLRDANDRAKMLADLGPGSVLVTSYGLLLRESDALSKVPWATLIFDESQALKNPTTQRYKAAQTLKAPLRLALTGTPVENHLGELHAQLHLLNPNMLGSPKAFREDFQRPIEAGDRNARGLLKKLVTPYMLRRTKGQVLHELPSRTAIDVEIELGPEEALLYEAERTKALEALSDRSNKRNAIEVLAQLSRLRQLACSPEMVFPDYEGASAKRTAFHRLVSDLREGGHRALVFSQFVKHLTLLRRDLDAQGIPYQYLDGSTPYKARDQAVDAFQRGDDPLFLISTRAGGAGLNLTAADYVIHMDPWWNPAVEDQASDRAHRLGQLRPVTIYRLFAKGTVETKILALHREKRDMAAQVLEGADRAAGMSAAELMALLAEG